MMFTNDGKFFILEEYDVSVYPYKKVGGKGYYYRIAYKEEKSDIYKYICYSLGVKKGFLPKLITILNGFILKKRIKKLKKSVAL